jgi:uncharacterized protein (TIGR03435 family)
MEVLWNRRALSVIDDLTGFGLKLQPRKMPVPVLVIDHIEPLIEN